MYQRTLSRAARTDHREHFPGFDFEIDVAQNFTRTIAVFSIGEANILKPDAGGEGGQRPGARFFSHVIFRIHELEQFRGCAQGLLKIIVKERELADRIVKLEYRHDE